MTRRILIILLLNVLLHSRIYAGDIPITSVYSAFDGFPDQIKCAIDYENNAGNVGCKTDKCLCVDNIQNILGSAPAYMYNWCQNTDLANTYLPSVTSYLSMYCSAQGFPNIVTNFETTTPGAGKTGSTNVVVPVPATSFQTTVVSKTTTSTASITSINTSTIGSISTKSLVTGVSTSKSDIVAATAAGSSNSATTSSVMSTQISPSAESSKTTHKSHTGAIVGGIVGGLAFAFILGLLFYFLCIRRARKRQYSNDNPINPQVTSINPQASYVEPIPERNTKTVPVYQQDVYGAAEVPNHDYTQPIPYSELSDHRQ